MKYLAILALFFCSLLENKSEASCYQAKNCTTCCQQVEDKGPYVSLIGGLDYFIMKPFFRPSSIDFFHPDMRRPHFKPHRTHYHPGFYVGASIGYKFANICRLEGEISYQRADMNYYKFRSFGEEKCKNKIKDGYSGNWSYMANILYDFDLNFPLKLYIGIGLGYSQNHLSYCRRSTESQIWFTGELRSGKVRADWGGFAWQPIVGISYPIFQNLKIGLDYRYFSSEHVRNHKVGMVLTRSF